MKAKVTRIFTLDEAQIKRFIEDRGYDEYSENDVDRELDYAEAYELEEYGKCDFLFGHDIRFEESP